jgi:hypothetical protein
MNRPFHRNDIDIRARQRDASYYKTGGGGRLLKEPSEATEAREREREREMDVKNNKPRELSLFMSLYFIQRLTNTIP